MTLVAKHFAQMGVVRWGHETGHLCIRARSRLPAFQAGDQLRPQRFGRLGYPQHQAPRVLDHLAANLQHKQNETLHVPAAADAVFKFIAADRVEVERQQRQQHRRFVFLETLRRVDDRLLGAR